jgi:hypothetical protein
VPLLSSAFPIAIALYSLPANYAQKARQSGFVSDKQVLSATGSDTAWRLSAVIVKNPLGNHFAVQAPKVVQ